MGVTISLRSFGQKNSWSFDPLRHPSIRSFRLIVALLGVAVCILFGSLLFSYHRSAVPVAESLDRLEIISSLMSQMMEGRVQFDRYLTSGDEASFTTGEAAFSQAIARLEALIITNQTVDAFALQRLEGISTDYLNLARSLARLQRGGDPVATTQQTIRQQIESTALQLDQAAQLILQSNIAGSTDLLHESTVVVTRTGVGLLLFISMIFAVSFIVVLGITRHTSDALHEVGKATHQIALGNYDFRIDPRAATNPDITQLATAFNRMAETLKTALESESTANRQNGLQLMKLAQQERVTAVLEERQRIARELHDSVKQQLFSITLSASAAINLLDPAPEIARTHIEHIRHAGHTAQTEMTALLEELIPVSLQEKRLEEALNSYLTPLCEMHGINLLWRVDGTNTLTIAEEHALLRALQEATANVIRHSNATLVRVSLSFGLVTHAIIEDNGVGFVPETVPATSTGLALMRTRLKRVGGRCQVESSPGAGTRLTISVDSRRTVTARTLSSI